MATIRTTNSSSEVRLFEGTDTVIGQELQRQQQQEAAPPFFASPHTNGTNMTVTTMSSSRLPAPVIITEEEELDLDDIIPGPSIEQRNRIASAERQQSDSSSKVLDLSLTDHHIKGGGILASRRDLALPAEEFAAGCNLLQAAARGDVAMMKQMLMLHGPKKLSVNFRDYDRRTALHVAASEGQIGVVQFLLDSGAKIHRSDRWGGSALDDAHRHQQTDVVALLRKHGATTGSLNQTSNLITAAAAGDLDEVIMLTECVQDLNGGDYDSRTALHLAAGEGHLDIARVLISAGANVNAEDRFGYRPLDDAIRHDHQDVAQLIRELGGTHGEQNGSLSHHRNTLMKGDTIGEDPNMEIDFHELEMIDRIGAGAFGEIYKCRWRGTLVAAKIIKSARIRKEWLAKHALKKMMEDESEGDKLLDEADQMNVSEWEEKDMALADFRQEIALLKALRHPNIVLLLAYSTTEDHEVMISELMKCNLLDVIQAHIIHGTKMKHKTMIVYAQQLALGMNYLHTAKPPVIHRDLKPANLLIDPSGVLKVSDFGLAKIRPDPSEGDTYRMTGETGSYRFMAPEVYRNEDYDETVDVYSYGMILYTLLSGKPPWPLLNGAVAVRKAAIEGERPVIPREWDLRLSRLLQECWDENRQHRPSFGKILESLDEYSHSKFHTKRNKSSEPLGLPPVVDTTTVLDGCKCVIM